MDAFPPTIILRHVRENLKKCSLRGLEGRQDMQFFTYPLKAPLPDLTDYVVLDLEGEPLSEKDSAKGLVLIDGTWRYAQKMARLFAHMEKRSLPAHFKTAYPRKQQDCPDPTRGLASVEALFIAYDLLKRDNAPLLDGYYWKELFLERNFKSLPTL